MLSTDIPYRITFPRQSPQSSDLPYLLRFESHAHPRLPRQSGAGNDGVNADTATNSGAGGQTLPDQSSQPGESCVHVLVYWGSLSFLCVSLSSASYHVLVWICITATEISPVSIKSKSSLSQPEVSWWANFKWLPLNGPLKLPLSLWSDALILPDALLAHSRTLNLFCKKLCFLQVVTHFLVNLTSFDGFGKNTGQEAHFWWAGYRLLWRCWKNVL